MRYWLRHDQPLAAQGRCYGWTDLALAVQPQVTLANLEETLPIPLPVFTSPLQRCRRLAEHLHVEPISLLDLREVNFGRWETQRWDDIPVSELDAWAATPYEFQFPEGESVPDFIRRVSNVMQRLPEHCIVVSHGGVIRVARHLSTGLSLSEAFATPVAFGSVHILPA
ncbi:MAG: histidine phosphatase family protein [Natronospirillum sp.]